MARLTKRHVTARVRWWQKRLGLSHWDIKVQYGKMEDGADAACLAAPEYRHAILHFNLESIPPEQIERFVAHEVLHTLVWPLANAAHVMAAGDGPKEEWVRTLEENLVTTLEHLLVSFVGE